jgi:hypothetical protein
MTIEAELTWTMNDTTLIYRHQIVRAVLGTRPAILARVHDMTALDRVCARLADAEAALEQLRARGYGTSGQTITEIVLTLPPAVTR